MKNIEVKITIPESEWSNWYDAQLGIEALKNSLRIDIDQQIYQMGINTFDIKVTIKENE